STLVIAGGIWFAYKGLVRRDITASVGGTCAAVAMLVIGLWVVHQPRDSVGRLASISDEVALSTISAPQSGSVSRPVGNYAEAMSRTWARLVEVPFAGLDFSDVKWALSKPPPEAVKIADEKFCDDVGALALLATLANLGNEEAQRACSEFARKRYGRPRRLIDLYLRSSPGSPARAALWQYFDKDEADKYKAKVAAQGGDGALTRLSMLALFAVGLIGTVLLLAWLAIRLFTQAAIAFILLLVAPFALFFPMLGDSGRRAFKTWGMTLVGAVIAKVIYAAFLSVVLLGMAILGAVGDATGFLLACAFAWAVYLKRAELVSWMRVGGGHDSGGSLTRMGELAGVAIAGRMVGSVGGALRGVRRHGGHALRRRMSDGAETTRATARGSLSTGARDLADRRYDEAKHTVAAYEGSDGTGGGPSGDAPGDGAGSSSKAADSSQKGSASPGQGADPSVGDATPRSGKTSTDGPGKSAGGGAPSPSRPSVEQYEDAKKLVARAHSNEERMGRPWSDRDLKKFGQENRQQLEQSNDPRIPFNPHDHAHRAGYSRSQFEELKGDAREQAVEKIKKATERDRKQLLVATETPGRIVGRGRQSGERIRQFKEGAGPDRRAELKRLRRERREARLAANRRNLSRGA
ncbi:MAG: hypothetical protein WBM00_06580, partial [Solirubrobacterales bacterium]